jgi:hypothetical protein
MGTPTGCIASFRPCCSAWNADCNATPARVGGTCCALALTALYGIQYAADALLLEQATPIHAATRKNDTKNNMPKSHRKVRTTLKLF